jgi:hypothetical protein
VTDIAVRDLESNDVTSIGLDLSQEDRTLLEEAVEENLDTASDRAADDKERLEYRCHGH